MKTSAVLASALLSAITIAAPVDRRALVFHTQIVTETVVVFTTVYDDDYVPQATTTPDGLFYERPKTTSSHAVVPTSSAAPSAVIVPTSSVAPSSVVVPTSSAVPEAQEPSSVPAPAPQTSTPAPVVASTPAPVVEQPQPTTSAYVAPAPAPVVSSAAPVVASPAPVSTPQPATGGTTTGETFSSVDMTVYDNDGHDGACGVALHDTDFIAALSKDAWGASTYDVMTGAATNPWCGQKIEVQYNGNTVKATIMDLCPGCSGHDIDLSHAAWNQVTDNAAPSRYKATWSKIA